MAVFHALVKEATGGTIAANRAYFGDFDPFGVFALIFGAAKLNLKCVEVPIRYRARTTNQGKKIRWTDAVVAAWTLLRYRGWR